MSEFNFRDLLIKHWGKIAGALVGLIFALVVVSFGFWKGIFIVICVIAGLILGWYAQEDGSGLRNLLEKIFKGN